MSTLNLDVLKQNVKEEIIDLLKDIPSSNKENSKIYITCPDYLFNLLTDLFGNMLTKKNSKLVYVRLSSIESSTGVAELIYFTTGYNKDVETALNLFKNVPRYFKAMFVIPRITTIIQQMILDAGFEHSSRVSDIVQYESHIYLREFHADFTVIEPDFFLMPCHNCLGQLLFESNYAELYSAARALAKIQMIYEVIPHVVTIGQWSERVADITFGMLAKANKTRVPYAKIDSLIIIDRMADPVAPLVRAPLIEQLYDEVYGVEFGRILNNQKQYTPIIDSAFSRFRSLHIADAQAEFDKYKDEFEELTQEIKQRQYRSKTDEALALAQLLGPKTAINHHQELMDGIYQVKREDPVFNAVFDATIDLPLLNSLEKKRTIENLISVYNSWEDALRVTILSCLTVGKSKKEIEAIQKAAVMEFGQQAISTFLQLERTRLLSSEAFPLSWADAKRKLDLTSEKLGWLTEPYNGFCPLSVRLVQAFSGLEVEDTVRQRAQELLKSEYSRISVRGERPTGPTSEQRRILVFFVGGVTLAEAAMIRRLGEGTSFEFIVGATDQVNGRSIVRQFAPFADSSTTRKLPNLKQIISSDDIIQKK